MYGFGWALLDCYLPICHDQLEQERCLHASLASPFLAVERNASLLFSLGKYHSTNYLKYVFELKHMLRHYL